MIEFACRGKAKQKYDRIRTERFQLIANWCFPIRPHFLHLFFALFRYFQQKTRKKVIEFYRISLILEFNKPITLYWIFNILFFSHSCEILLVWRTFFIHIRNFLMNTNAITKWKWYFFSVCSVVSQTRAIVKRRNLFMHKWIPGLELWWIRACDKCERHESHKMSDWEHDVMQLFKHFT